MSSDLGDGKELQVKVDLNELHWVLREDRDRFLKKESIMMSGGSEEDVPSLCPFMHLL
jgi:hypothetical protein